MPLVRIGSPVKARLDALQAAAEIRLDRQVTLSEVIEGLVAEHEDHQLPRWPMDENGVPR